MRKGFFELGFASGLFLVACTGGPAATEPELPDVLKSVATYEEGQFLYESGECTFVPPGPESHDPIPFVCGELLIGLQAGVDASDVSDLLAEISGEVLRDRSGGDFGYLLVKTETGSERDGILRAFQDTRIRYASPNFTGPAVILGS